MWKRGKLNMPRGKRFVDALIILLTIILMILTITYIKLVQDMPQIYALVPTVSKVSAEIYEKIEKPKKGFVIVNEDGDTAFVPYYVEGIIV